ncbi:MAG: hypothetical protein Q8896_06705 [Bacteroidota bacterium]|nr:hypothetical protein [Bacteroidota bacterium]MDP4237062.1 hypothetical protein [Bacteroidota bacterium]
MARAWKVLAAFVLVLSVSFAGARLNAQPTTGTGTTANPQTQGNTPQVNWSEELKNAQEESRALKSILSAIESIDTARQSELIQWIVTDRSVRSRVISALRKAGKNISPSSNADLVVTQKPPTKIEGELNNQMDLLKIVIESIGVYGTPQIKRILGEDLYNKINNRADYEYTMLSSEQEQQRIQYANISASIFGGDIVFKSGFGFGMNVGYDYLGWPFWMQGNVGVVGIIHKEMTDVRIGLDFPLGEAGLTPFVVAGGLKIKERKLEGTQGFQAQIDQMLDVFSSKKSGRLSLGGEFFDAFTPSTSTFSQRAADTSQFNRYRTSYHGTINGVAKDSLFYLGLSGHLWVQYAFAEGLRGAYIQLGGGTHRVNAVTVGTKSGIPSTNVDLVDAGSFSQFDPLIKIGFNHPSEGGYDYGMSLQYCNELLADGFVRIFTWLNLEVKYAAVVFRDPKKWEQTDFFIITPVLKLNF